MEEAISSRIARLENEIQKQQSIENRLEEVARQVQRLQGGSGLLEPQSSFSAWDEDSPYATPPTQPTVTYVGQAAQLLAGRYMSFTRMTNTPYLRLDVAGSNLMNADYVVDSNGFGSHTTLFGASGALAAAIATGLDAVIWVCTTHTETTSAVTSLNGLSNSQQITIMSGGPFRPYIVRGHSGAIFSCNTSSGATGDPTMRFVGLNFTTDTGTGNQPLITLASGVIAPSFDFEDVGFSATSGTSWTYFVDAAGSGSATTGRLYIRRCRDLGDGAVTGIVNLISTSASVGSFWMEGSVFRGLTNMSNRSGTTEVDWGLGSSNQIHGIFIENNILGFTGTTSFLWKRTYNNPMRIVGNHIRFVHTSGYGIVAGTAATTSPKDVTITGNEIFCMNAGGGAIQVSAGAGTASNINITGNAIAGPGSGTAITLDVAAESTTDGYMVVNSYRDWTTNIGGTAAASAFSGIDHGSLSGRSDDDHTIYLLADGTRSLTGDWNAGTSYSITAGKLIIDDTNLYLDLDTTVGGSTTYGKTSIGGSTVASSTEQQFGYKVTIATTVRVTSLSHYMSLNTLTRAARLCIYSDNAGVPDALQAYTSDITVTTTPGWFSGAIAFNAAGGSISSIDLPAGTYWLTVHDRGGGGFTFTHYYDTGSAGEGYDTNTDTYTGGPEDPWSGGSSSSKNLSIYMTGSPLTTNVIYNVDSTDALNYTRATNTWGWMFASSDAAQLTASGILHLGYGRIGSLTAPTNTTAGDLTTLRLKVGDGAFGTGVDFSVTGDGALSGFLRVGSETAPTNTTAGDLTFVRGFVDNDSNFNIAFSGATPALTFDTGDLYAYDRTGDQHVRYVGSSIKELLTGSGYLTSGYMRVGSTSAPTNTTAGDLTATRLVVGASTVAFGATAGRIARFDGTLTDTASGAAIAMIVNPTLSPSGNSSSEFRALYFQQIIADTNTRTFNIVAAGTFENRWRNDGAVTESTALWATAAIIDSSSPATVGTITLASSFEPRVFGRPSGSSTIAITTGVGVYFRAGRFITGAGATFTDLYNIKIEDQTTNTITNFYGIDIAKLTRGTTNIEFRNAGKSVYTPTTQTLSAAGNTIVNTATMLFVDNSTGALLTMTSTPTIAVTGAQNGQILIIVNTDSADSIALQDESGAAGTKLRLPGAATLTLGPKDNAMFIYNSTAGEWYCIGTANL